ncbi:MAG: SpoIVB peptidase [Clostridium sp.]|uniref:SpoIVB peptidase n=1 Tax=Clostridium sp. TaxID=1506 RepID=UPI002FC7440E
MKLKFPQILISLLIVIAVTFSVGFVKVASLPESLSITSSKLELNSLDNNNLKSNIIYTVETFNNTNTLKEDLDLNVKLFGIIPVKTVTVNLKPDIKLIPGGKPIGIKLYTEGIIVVGFSDVDTNDGNKESPGIASGIEIGDVLLEANGEKLNEINTLSSVILKSKGNKIKLKIKRREKTENITVSPVLSSGEYKVGLWVRNTTSGVGTLTFYDEKSGVFGALGHPINDIDTGKLLTIREGSSYDAKIISVEKGEKGNPGELRGIFHEKDQVGSLSKNSFSGVYGKSEKMKNQCKNLKPISIGRQNEVKEGPAKILTCVDGVETKEYSINIEKVINQTKPSPKSMVIKVTDKELLEKTGGIVQGMSGSPIIQNGKIVGAVTHVFVNNPTMGYGIYIEWMLKDGNVAS